MSSGATVTRVGPPGLGTLVRVPRPDGTALAVGGLVALAAALRFTRIGHQSLWYDEAFTVRLVHQSVGGMLDLLPKTELTPPLYYLLVWAWAHVFGTTAGALRSLSALAGVATVPAMYGAGAALVSRRAGLVAAALACCNPLLVWYSQEARSYALVVLLATLTLLTFARARATPLHWGRLAAWTLAAAATLATHYYAVLIVAPEAVGLLWVHRRNPRILAPLLALAAAGGGLLPLAISQRPKASWIAPWRLDRRLQQIPTQFLTGMGARDRVWLELAGAAVALLAAAVLVGRASGRERGGGLTAGAIAVAGLAGALGLVAVGVDELITRNVIIVLVSAIVLFAAGLGAQRAGAVGLAGAGVLCAIGLIATATVAFTPGLQRPDWRGLARALGADRPTPGGRAIMLERYVFVVPLNQYVPGLRAVPPAGRVRELDIVAVAPPRDSWFCWWGSQCNVPGARLDAGLRLPGFAPAGPPVRHGEFTFLRLRARRPHRISLRLVDAALVHSPIGIIQPFTADSPWRPGAPVRYGLFLQSGRAHA